MLTKTDSSILISMEPSSSLSYLMFDIIMLLFLCLVFTQKAFSYRCHDDERSALLQFKQSFVIYESASGYPKVSSWNVEGGDKNSSKDCCLWDGIDCDKDTGHVIGLDLSSSLLFGSINSSSSLFHLVHIRRLNLARNDFSRSKIPTGLVHLSKLTYLNLSHSNFSGEVPQEISHLSMLSSLDLSYNSQLLDFSSNPYSLTLNGSSFTSLIHNLTNIKQLLLSNVNIHMPLTAILENLPSLSSLTTLDLAYCGLYGEIPGRVFNLPKLQHLDLGYNLNLRGSLPEFNSSNTLTHLRLAGTSIRMLPASLGKLSQLIELDLSDCFNLSGHIPSSIGNLSQLIVLDLSYCKFSGQIPSTIGNLRQLIELRLSDNNFSGKIPSSIGNLSLLTTFYLSSTNLEGQVPSSFYQLKNLESLDLSGNRLSGMVDLDMFVMLRNLSRLTLSDNNLSVISSSTSSNTNTTIAQLQVLELKSCKLTKFPAFLQNQTNLSTLTLSNNSIQGLIPIWVFNLSVESLGDLDLSYNSLTGFDQSPVLLPQHSNLFSIILNHNELTGSLPIPPPSIYEYDVSNNALDGEVSPFICNLTSLTTLDLSYNGFSGKLPPCLMSSVPVLNLRRNYFRGTIPDVWTNECRIGAMVLSENQFEGELPRSLANCTILELLDVGYNEIKDTFPFWLGTLPDLKILVVKFNRFYGVVKDPDPTKTTFPKLNIVDLSHNSFSGHLPRAYFNQWNSMIFDETREWDCMYDFVTLTYKGIAREYGFVQNLLNLIDLSSNKFEGDIPESIANLNGLKSLNLSHNFLTGRIPSSLGNLSQIEALDLSHNNLSGQIPQQLTLLNFLAIFSVAHNNLTGPIPHGKQFDTFLDSYYEGNAGLCGKPLSEECGNLKDSPPPPSESTVEEEDKGSPLEFGWKPVLIGYGCGLVIGIVIGHFVINRRYGWFVYTFRIRLPK